MMKTLMSSIFLEYRLENTSLFIILYKILKFTKKMKTLKFKTIDEFQSQIMDFNKPELADCLLEAIQRGMEKGNKKVSVCDVEIEDEEDIFRLYTDQKDWPVALASCMKTFIAIEEYEKCIIVQELQKEYEINKLVTEVSKPSRRKNSKK